MKTTIRFAAAVLVTVIFLFPIYWLFTISFKTPDEIFDIREAYKCTAVTFGPGVCYDCPAKITYQQFGFFKTCLDSERFRSYVPIIEQEVASTFRASGARVGRSASSRR